jgi:hypothetical protein
MSIKDVATNIKRRGFKDILDADTRRAFTDFSQIEEHGLLLDSSQIVCYTEQLQYRMSKCAKCNEAGRCNGYDTKGCGCPTPGKFIPPSAHCPESRWGKMLEHAEWEQYKQENNIQIIVSEA